MQKGEFGYIRRRKKRILVMLVVILLAAVIIFAAGLLLNKMSKANIFTVLAILCVLPWAKQIVALVVFFPYHSVSEERYQKAEAVLGEKATLYTDLVVTSPEKIMHLDFAVVGRGQVIALVGKAGQDIAYIRRYLTDGIHNWGSGYKVKIVDSEKLFLREIGAMPSIEADAEEEERVKSYLLSLIV